MKKILSTILLTIGFLSAQVPYDNSGSKGNIFLRSDLSPRAASLGGAFTAVANDESTIFYNPAGLANLNYFSSGLNHTQWFMDIKMDNLILAYKLDQKLGLAFSIAHLWMPEIQGMDNDGAETEKFTVSSSILAFGAGYKIHPSIYAGLNLKYFQDKLDQYSTSGIAADLGIYAKIPVRGIRLAASLQNLSGKVQYDSAQVSIPFTYRVGASYQIPNIQTAFSLDIVKASDTGVMVNTGFEYDYDHILFFRLGNSMRNEQILNLAFGAGFKLKKHYFLDYAFLLHSELGATHRIGFSFRLDTPEGKDRRIGTQTSPITITPDPPIKIKYEVLADQLSISWNKVASAQYNVYARLTEAGDWTKLTKHPLYSNQMKFKKPSQTNKIIIVVTSVINNLESSYSKELEIHVK